MVAPRLDRRALALDAVLAGASLAVGLLLLALDAYRTLIPATDAPRAVFVLPLMAACAAVFLRRLAPVGSLAVGTTAAAGDLFLGGSLGTLLVYTQVLYDACVYGPPRLWRWLLGLSVGATLAGAVVGVAALRDWRGVGVGVVVVLLTVLPVLTGISVRQYRDQAAAERARAEQTARLVELDRRQAITAERTRMARELHDVVANHLSAVAIHATAALSLPDLDRAGIRRALTVIRSSGVEGLAEMRRMIALLRDADDETGGGLGGAAPASLDEADALVERVRTAGLPVSVARTGAPRPLPVGVDLAAYRILQEALTNALKHGVGPARVAISYAVGHLAVTVDNPLPGGPGAPLPAVPGAGAGLVGMRERTELLAGRFSAGPVDGAGLWRVHAELPTRAVAA